MKPATRTRWLRGTLTALAWLAASVPARAGVFQPGDRWTAIGDSITHDGSYYAWIYLYQVTRFPGASLAVTNAGISGDSAAGALQRYEWDVRASHPTVATIMLGMNDVDRDAYAIDPPTADMASRRAAALARYRENMTTLVARLRADGARVVLITPSPFDEQVAVAFPRLRGVNAALADCATFLRQLAAEQHLTVLDLHRPLSALNTARQRTDPTFTTIGPDRVHPGTAGHLAMAYFFLRDAQAPATVSRLTIDAGRQQVQAERATIEYLTSVDGGITFRATEEALPFPVPDSARAALDWVPFQHDLNQETLEVSGLAPGRYQLSIDGVAAGEFAADQFLSGINLADLADTPQLRQAREVLRLIQEWRELVAGSQRTLAAVEFWTLRDVPHPIRLQDVRARVLQERARLEASTSPNRQWDLPRVERYLVLKPQEAALAQHLDALQARLRAAAQPQPHEYRILPLPASR